LVSFIPWILYWVLTSFVGGLGVVLAFLSSLAIIFIGLFRRDVGLMDIATLIYFVVVFVAVFFFGLNIFIERSGFLGYLALSVMAIFSLVIKQPFTFQVSRKDYPEVYWKDRLFISINNVITVVWGLIFFVNALIYLVLEQFLSVVLSNIFVVVGIAFSIIYPVKASAYQSYKEFRKFDWRIDIDPKRSKNENEYDVIIVGAGI
jgi:all-trans-retinol 13,14-reductase